MKLMYITESDLNHSWSGQKAFSNLHTIYEVQSMEFELCFNNKYNLLLDLNINYGKKLYSVESQNLNVQKDISDIRGCLFSYYDMKKYLYNLNHLHNLNANITHTINGKYLDRLSKPNNKFSIRTVISLKDLEYFMNEYKFIKLAKKSEIIYNIVKKSSLKHAYLAKCILDNAQFKTIEISKEIEDEQKNNILNNYMSKKVYKKLPKALVNEKKYIEKLMGEEKLSYIAMQKKVNQYSQKFASLQLKQKERFIINYDNEYNNISLKKIIIKLESKHLKSKTFLEFVINLLKCNKIQLSIDNYKEYVKKEFILQKQDKIIKEIITSDDSLIESLIIQLKI